MGERHQNISATFWLGEKAESSVPASDEPRRLEPAVPRARLARFGSLRPCRHNVLPFSGERRTDAQSYHGREEPRAPAAASRHGPRSTEPRRRSAAATACYGHVVRLLRRSTCREPSGRAASQSARPTWSMCVRHPVDHPPFDAAPAASRTGDCRVHAAATCTHANGDWATLRLAITSHSSDAMKPDPKNGRRRKRIRRSPSLVRSRRIFGHTTVAALERRICGSVPNDHAFSGGAQAPSAATRG